MESYDGKHSELMHINLLNQSLPCLIETFVVFFFNDTATTEIYTLSLHDALPISAPTGTTPSLTPTLQISDNGAAFANVAAGTAISTATTQAIAFTNAQIATAVTSYNNTHTYMLRIALTAGNADNVCTDVTVDLVATN